jgi:N-acetylneuraminate synthase
LRKIKIAGRAIGPGEPVYIIAEISANHNQDFEEAAKLVRIAAECGADAVKLQTYTADTITIDSDKEPFRVGPGTIWEGRGLYELYQEAAMPWDWQPQLKQVADGLGIHLFSSAFDSTAVDFLEEMHVPAYKIASFELVDVGLIQKCARTGKPMIMSTGMAEESEIAEAVAAARAAGCEELALLHCNSAYPARPSEMNLQTIPYLANLFDVPVGLSDHTLGVQTSVAAVAMGANIIEKHFTFSRSVPGPDSKFSLEPEELKNLIDEIRTTEAMIGHVAFGATEKERASLRFRRSLFAVEDISAGAEFTAKNVRSIRPADGLPPREFAKVLGRKAARMIERGTPLSWDLIKD